MKRWKVYTNSIAGEKVYTVGHIIDENEPLHGGNLESDSCHDSKTDAQARCDELNKLEKLEEYEKTGLEPEEIIPFKCIILETEEAEPKIVGEITADAATPADGFRFRLKS